MNKLKQNKKSYVVLRDGIRVSEKEYVTKSDAKDELSYWNKLLERWPDGTKVEIVEKKPRKHRVYNL